MKIAALGVAWYRESDYQRARDLFEDGASLPATYKQWLQAAENLMESRKGSGTVIEKVYIVPDEFAAWCRARGLNVNSKARVAFASEFVARTHGNID